MGVLSTLRLRSGLGCDPRPNRGACLHEIVTALNVVNSVTFVVLAAIAVRLWRRKRDGAAGWD